MTFIGIVTLVAFTLVAISLQRSYVSIPPKELKRRARAGDKVAAGLYKAAVYGSSLSALLRLFTILSSGLLFIVISRQTETWLAFLVIAGVLGFGFMGPPAYRATKLGVWMARVVSLPLAKVLQYLHPMFDRINRVIRNNRPISFHTGLYDKEDLLELFTRQKVQADSRIDQQTLAIVEHALQFGDKKVSQIQTPRRVVKAVSANDTIGPIMMDDLHKSGHSRFPVYEGKHDNIVGILYLRSLIKKNAEGPVSKNMSKQVCYVHEDQPLSEALQAILSTHQQLFIVVNSFEEYVGIVTIEDIMEAIVGKQIVDEFDEYEDLRAVAAKMAFKEHKKHDQKDIDHENIQSVTEVIE